MSELGQRIAEERQRSGITRAALARRVGVSDVSVCYWERGTIKQIGHDNLLALARAFGCTVSELLEDPMLDARVAEKQAEVLDEMYRDFDNRGLYGADLLRDRALQLHQQAEKES